MPYVPGSLMAEVTKLAGIVKDGDAINMLAPGTAPVDAAFSVPIYSCC